LNPPNAFAARGLPSTAGFTLIEVMAALVIVSLGMMAVIQAVGQTASNSVYLREKTIAHWVAMNRITEMRLASQAPSIGESSGEVEMAGQHWRWSAQVTQTDVQTMKRIDVSVASVVDAKSSLDKQNQLDMTTGFYGDKIAQPGIVFALFDLPPASPTATTTQSTTPVAPTNPVSVPPTATTGTSP
jgi:general secretion pathway protein I